MSLPWTGFPVYRFVAQLPASSAVINFPSARSGAEVRYMFYATSHWRLVNGYSGGARRTITA